MRSDLLTLASECVPGGLQKTMTGYDTLHTDVCGFSSMSVGYINIFYRNGIDYTEELDMRRSGYWSMVQSDEETAEAIQFASNNDVVVYKDAKKNGYLVRCIKK